MSEKKKKSSLLIRLLKAFGIFLVIVFSFILMLGLMNQPVDYNLVVIGFTGIIIGSLVHSMAAAGNISEAIEKVTIIEIKCSNNNCDNREYRKFTKGDYVYKKLDKCDKCKNGVLIINNIFQVDSEDEALKLIEKKGQNKGKEKKIE
ncbi:MAG: hypothetical protein ACTSRP_06040 [Candidatus Helarchaeota archaeon]